MIRWLPTLLATCALGCAADLPASGSGSPDAASPAQDGAAGNGTDAGALVAGLVLDVRGLPDLPTILGGEFSIELESAIIDLENIRLIGDSAPGDARTTRSEMRLEWPQEGDESEYSVRTEFNQAPPGVYSLVLAQVTSYRFQGELQVGDDTFDFEIDDELSSPLSVSLDLDGLVLEANSVEQVVVEVDVTASVLAPDWNQAENDGGELEFDKDDDQIDDIRAAVLAGFRLGASGLE